MIITDIVYNNESLNSLRIDSSKIDDVLLTIYDTKSKGYDTKPVNDFDNYQNIIGFHKYYYNYELYSFNIGLLSLLKYIKLLDFEYYDNHNDMFLKQADLRDNNKFYKNFITKRFYRFEYISKEEALLIMLESLCKMENINNFGDSDFYVFIDNSSDVSNRHDLIELHLKIIDDRFYSKLVKIKMLGGVNFKQNTKKVVFNKKGGFIQ